MKTISQQPLAPVYFFYGLETYLMEKKIASIRQQLNVNSEEFGMITMDLSEVPIQDLIMEAQTLSLFSEQRLIIGKNAEFLMTGKSKGSVNHQVESLIQYLQQPVESNVVILTLPTDKVDRRKKVVKDLMEKAQVEECAPLSGRQLLQWLKKRMQREHLVIEEPVLKQLLLWVGNDLHQLDQECRKLAIYVGKQGKVTMNEVNMLIPRTLEQDVFKLIQQLSVRNRERAIEIWSDLLYQKEEPIRILALIIRQLRLMLYAKILSAKGKTEKEMAKALNVHPYPVKLALRQGAVYSKEELNDYLSRAIRIDQMIKSGRGEKEILIEQLLLSW